MREQSQRPASEIVRCSTGALAALLLNACAATVPPETAIVAFEPAAPLTLVASTAPIAVTPGARVIIPAPPPEPVTASGSAAPAPDPQPIVTPPSSSADPARAPSPESFTPTDSPLQAFEAPAAPADSDAQLDPLYEGEPARSWPGAASAYGDPSPYYYAGYGSPWYGYPAYGYSSWYPALSLGLGVGLAFASPYYGYGHHAHGYHAHGYGGFHHGGHR